MTTKKTTTISVRESAPRQVVFECDREYELARKLERDCESLEFADEALARGGRLSQFFAEHAADIAGVLFAECRAGPFVLVTASSAENNVHLEEIIVQQRVRASRRTLGLQFLGSELKDACIFLCRRTLAAQEDGCRCMQFRAV